MTEKIFFELVDREKIPFNQKPILNKWVFTRKIISGTEKDFLILESRTLVSRDEWLIYKTGLSHKKK